MDRRIFYFDLLKVLAIIMVVINHSYWWCVSNSPFGRGLNVFLLMFSKAAVPLFFMVSGALILSRKTTYKEVFTKRIVRVLIPLILVSIIWTIYKQGNMLLLPAYILNGSGEQYIPYWIWYLYAIIALYVMTPFLQKMLSKFKKRDYLIFIVLFLVIPSFLKMISTILPFIIGKTIIFNPDFFDILFPVQIGYYVTGYFLAGNYIKITKKCCNISFAVLIFTLLFSTLFTLYVNDNSVLDSYSYFTTAVEAICIFTIIKFYFNKGLSNQTLEKVITNISNSVFGVYLFHCFVIDFLLKIYFIKAAFNLNGFLGLFLMDGITLIVLTIVVYFLRKILILKKFL